MGAAREQHTACVVAPILIVLHDVCHDACRMHTTYNPCNPYVTQARTLVTTRLMMKLKSRVVNETALVQASLSSPSMSPSRSMSSSTLSRSASEFACRRDGVMMGR